NEKNGVAGAAHADRVRDRDDRRRVDDDPVEVLIRYAQQLLKARAAGEVRGAVADAAAGDEDEVVKERCDEARRRARLGRALHGIRHLALAGEVVGKARVRLATEVFLQGGAAHVTIDEQHLAALVKSERECEVGGDEALALLRHAARYEQRLQTIHGAELLEPRTEAAELLDHGAALLESREALNRDVPVGGANLGPESARRWMLVCDRGGHVCERLDQRRWEAIGPIRHGTRETLGHHRRNKRLRLGRVHTLDNGARRAGGHGRHARWWQRRECLGLRSPCEHSAAALFALYLALGFCSLQCFVDATHRTCLSAVRPKK